MPDHRPFRTALASLLLLCGLCLCGCSTARFYSQAIGGQLEIWRKSRPNAEVLADSKVDDKIKRRLQFIEELRAFAASDLGLPTKSFGSYCDLQRPYVVWVVFAAPEFSVEAKRWWYPFLGSLKYRGFFEEKLAKAEGERLRKKGLDVFVGGVEAYSTLGYFKDPVLNTFIHRSEHELAELVFHELTHAKLFIPGDTDFNEAFATANAQDGVRRWLRSKNDVAGLRAYEHSLKLTRSTVGLLLDTRARLEALYAQEHASLEAKREAKQQVFVDMLRRAGANKPETKVRSQSGTGLRAWNNARLNTISSYYTLVPGFERLLAKHQGNLSAFHEEVASMRKLSKDERRSALESPAAVPASRSAE